MMGQMFTYEFWRDIVQSAGREGLYTFWDVVKIAIFYLVARFILSKLIDRVAFPVVQHGQISGDESRVRRMHTLQSLLKSTVSYVLFFICAVMLLKAFKVDPMPVVVSAGVVGLAVGFGAQRLVRDVISGFFIILENQYAVGEYVTVSGITGTVTDVGLRLTRIRGDDGKLYLFSNGDLTLICNHSRGAVGVSVDVTISAEEDATRAARILDEVGEEFAKTARDMESPFQVIGMPAFSVGSVTMRMEGRALPPGLEDLQMAFREKVRERLLAEGIKLA